MRKPYRMISKPGTFIGQLQWSRHHWYILFTFLTLVGLDTILGAHHARYEQYAHLLQWNLGIGADFALFLVMGLKMALILGGAFALASVVWFIGNTFGRRTSKRVLFRRLAVVFTVLIAGSLFQHNDWGMWSVWAAYGFYAWGVVLAYHAVREQFALGTVEAGIVGALALLLAVSAWHYADHAMDWAVKEQVQHQIAKPSPRGRAARPVW